MASIVDPPPDGKTQPDGVREISPEAALWLVRRSLILDYLNEHQPVDQRHNKRMAADLTREVQAWCHADVRRAALVQCPQCWHDAEDHSDDFCEAPDCHCNQTRASLAGDA